MNLKIEKDRLVLVEGKDEELLFEVFTHHLGLDNLQIMGIAGKDNLPKVLKALTKSPGFVNVISLGIVRDADSDPKSSFQSVCSALQQAGLTCPTAVLTFAGHNPRVMVMILPDAQSSGELEDLCLRAIENDPAISCVEKYFRCLTKKNIPLSRKLSKAKIQAFLASRLEPGKRLGEAAQAGYFPPQEPAFSQLHQFLRDVAS